MSAYEEISLIFNITLPTHQLTQSWENLLNHPMMSNFSPFTSLPHLSQIHSHSTKHFRVYKVLVFTSAERHTKYMEHTMLPFTLRNSDSFSNVSTSTVLFSPLCNESISVVSISVSATTTQRFSVVVVFHLLFLASSRLCYYCIFNFVYYCWELGRTK